MGQDAKVNYDRRADQDRRKNNNESFPLCDSSGEAVKQERRYMRDRRADGLELSTDDLADDEFEEVFKQFQKSEPEIASDDTNNAAEKLEIINYQVLYRKGVECAYITILQTDEDEKVEPTLYVFPDDDKHTEIQSENKPVYVQNIFGSDAYQQYLEQGWDDISKSENNFPWAIKAWIAQNMKQDEIKSR